MIKIGIIGFGRFGRFISNYLKRDFKILVTDVLNKREEARKVGVKFSSLSEVCSSNIIILSVPISKLHEVLEKIKGLIKKRCLVVDVCSVKEFPCKLMKKVLPKNIELLGTHPLFGPDSAKRGLKGKKIVICPVRISKETIKKVKKYFENKGLKVIESTPSGHDKQIARSLNLVHFIGRALFEMGISEQEIDTAGYKKLIKLMKDVIHDSWELFIDMNIYNRFSKNVRKKFINTLKNLEREIECQSRIKVKKFS